MERSKWEEEFREKLNQREIAPTPHAWDRLDAMLNQADESGKPLPTVGRERKINWFYIAAGVAAVLLMATFYFGSKPVQQNQVVDQTPVRVEERQSPVDSDRLPSIEKLVPAVESQIASADATPSEKAEKSGSKLTQSNIQIVQEDKQPSRQEVPNHINETDVAANQLVNQTAIANTDVNDLEVKIQKPKGVKVDARSLLAEVDGELEMTFREKTIKSLSKTYQDVKVALANRNQE